MTKEKETIINGIDVSESVLTATNNNIYYSQIAVDELQNNIKRLQEENEKIKKQYNCYACGNCNGKENYIHLEKHHKGLRKQFDELAKRNNTLSLRIEELEKEKEELKEKIKSEKYIKENALQEATKYSMKCGEFRQALEEIREIAKENINCEGESHPCPQSQEILDLINEVLNDN